MNALKDLGLVESADVLVIGGGVGGLVAAVAAKEKDPDADVLVVEKASSGWAGQANKGAGVWWYLAPEDDVERFVQFHCEHIGHYIEDQELLADFGRESLAGIARTVGRAAVAVEAAEVNRTGANDARPAVIRDGRADNGGGAFAFHARPAVR